MTVILEAKGIQKRFGGVIALKDGNIKCEAGKITGLLGANGSGKSTLSKIITGVYHADAGEITYQGKSVNFRAPIDARREGISMVFQNLSLLEDLTIWQNVVIGSEKTKGLFLDNKDAKKLTEEIIAELQPGINTNKYIYELSPAEMQIVEITKALAEKPKLIIFDEPTAALQAEEVKRLFAYMRKLAKEGTSIIFTSHRLGEIKEICDEIVIFRNGENVGFMDFTKGEKDTNTIIKLLTGEESGISVTKNEIKKDAETLFEIEGLKYGKYLRDVSLELKKGEILGIGGLAGQGQVELLHALACAYPEQRFKSVKMLGKDIAFRKPRDANRNGICFVPGDRQKEGLFMSDSVLFNIIVPKYGLRNQRFFIPKKEYTKQTEEVINILSIKTENTSTMIKNLSGGNQQKVAVGKWLPLDLRIMLLDDPAKGVDIGSKKDLYEFFVNKVRESGMSIILYASDNEELINYCDRLLIMYEGKIVQELAGGEITDESIIAASMQVSRQ